jgi:enoyl-CoA hydratase/carnithine racemase
MSSHAIAGGCILALMCDVRIIAEGARIGLNESEFGIAAPPWTASMLRNTVGPRHAERSLCLGTLYEAGVL